MTADSDPILTRGSSNSADQRKLNCDRKAMSSSCMGLCLFPQQPFPDIITYSIMAETVQQMLMISPI